MSKIGSNGEKNINKNIGKMDYYAILGVSKDASSKEIKRAYHKKLSKYHPDKAKDTDDKDTLKIKWKLIREAGNVLTNKYKKNAYDMERKMEHSSTDHIIQKDSFKKFLELQKAQMTEENKKLAKLNYENEINELNKKHGYTQNDDKPISKDEFNRRREDMESQRYQEKLELEIETDDLFEGKQFDPNEFNKLFMMKKKREKNIKGELVKACDDVAPFNNDIGDNIGTLDDYDNLYAEGKFNGFSNNYTGIGDGLIGNISNINNTNDEVNDDDILSIDSLDDEDYDYDYDKHNVNISKEDIDTRIKRMMDERNEQNKLFENGEYRSTMEDKYSISSQLGFMVGDSKFFGHQTNDKKTKLKEKTMEVYKELTE